MKTLIIINPLSGGQHRELADLEKAALINFPHADGVFTKYAGHATELAAKAAKGGYDWVIAAGGDGTINETAKALVGTHTALGIIPKGSGNGLARELGMPLMYEQAWVALQKAEAVACDVGVANGEYFFNLAGVGIEAQIAKDFAEYGKTGKRGKWPYFKLGAKAVFSYEPKTLRVRYNGKDEIITPLTLVFANGSQYGSNFTIAPRADLTDGQLDMVEVSTVSKWKMALAAPTFFNKTFRPFDITHTQKTAQAIINYEGEIVYHLDGEPKITQNELKISVLPKALKLLIPHKF